MPGESPPCPELTQISTELMPVKPLVFEPAKELRAETPREARPLSAREPAESPIAVEESMKVEVVAPLKPKK
jgi:hypothetical protein